MKITINVQIINTHKKSREVKPGFGKACGEPLLVVNHVQNFPILNQQCPNQNCAAKESLSNRTGSMVNKHLNSTGQCSPHLTAPIDTDSNIELEDTSGQFIPKLTAVMDTNTNSGSTAQSQISSRQIDQSARSSDRGAAGNTAGSEPPPPARRSSTISETGRRVVSSVTIYFLLLLRDLLTFFIRGGLTAMMFAMDQTLQLFLLITEIVLGPTVSAILGYPSRTALWIYQLLLWVVYTMVELVLYLPWKILAVYLAVIVLALLFLPPEVTYVCKSLFTQLHNFIGYYKGLFRIIGRKETA